MEEEMSILLFTSNKLGAMLLSELDKRKFYPEVVTYTKGFQRTALAVDLGVYRKQFQMSFIASNSFAESGLPELAGRTAVCVDWTKDFFRDVFGDVIYAHPSLLPAYRGYSAVTEQFERGVAVSGASFYMHSDRVDAGDIIEQKEIRIEFNDYPSDYFVKYAAVCADFIVELNRKGLASYERRPQNEEEAFYLQRKRGRDAVMDFRRDAFSLYNHIRGYGRPFFGAYFLHNGEKIIVWRAMTEKWQGDYGKPGSVINVSEEGMEIACGSGTIVLTEIERNGQIYKGDSVSVIASEVKQSQV